MEIKSHICLCLMILLLVVNGSVVGYDDTGNYDWKASPIQSDKTMFVQDWMSPHTIDRPEWDPFGPESTSYPAADRTRWDPYGPAPIDNILRLEPATPPFENLIIQGDLRTANQLYLQKNGVLMSDGSVLLGEPYSLWAFVSNRGGFRLFDNDEIVLSQGYMTPGWYKITGLYSEILLSHEYLFVSGGIPSNRLTVLVDSGNYLRNYGINGRVVDEIGKGMSSVRIIAIGSEGGTYTTLTNPEGYYGLNLPSGVYTITAENPGYAFSRSTARTWAGTVSATQEIIGYRVTR
jgi:hypothetical protein